MTVGEQFCGIWPQISINLFILLCLLFANAPFPDPKSSGPHHNLLHQIPKSILKLAPPPASKPSPPPPLISAPKVALMPPSKQSLQAPPLPPPKPTQKPLPPLPPPKPSSPTSPPPPSEQLQHPTNDGEDPPSPLRSPDECKAPEENGEPGLEGELEVGSMVEVNDPPLFGVIRWIGSISGVSQQVAGIELVSRRPEDKGWANF